jgi:hypothetical protein
MKQEKNLFSSNKRKNQLINMLINKGIYKKEGKHLYDLSVTDLEKLCV